MSALTSSDPLATPLTFGYTSLKTLGSGSFGSVTLCSREGLPPGPDEEFPELVNKYALKSIPNNRPARVAIFAVVADDDLPPLPTSNEAQALPSEASILQKLDHPNIPLLYQILLTPAATTLVLEYSPSGCLTPSLPSALLLNTILPKVASALDYIHALGFAHLDVKPQNILLSPTFQPRLADFGSSLSLAELEEQTAVYGTLQYLSPLEAASHFTRKGYCPVLADFFSLAATVYHCLAGGQLHKLTDEAPLEESLKVISAYTPVETPYPALNALLKISNDNRLSSRGEGLRRTLHDYYSRQAPDELHKVPALVDRVIGGPATTVGGLTLGGVLWTEEELFEKVAAKYGGCAIAPVSVSERWLLEEFRSLVGNDVTSESSAALKHLYASDSILLQSPTLIMITGPSGSGKSTFAATFEGHSVIRQDDYFTSPFIPYPERADDSREQFDGNVDEEKLIGDTLAALSKGNVVVEGHVIHRCAALVGLADKIIVLEAAAEECRSRRIGRQARSEEAAAELGDYIDRIVTPFYGTEKLFLDAFRDDVRVSYVADASVQTSVAARPNVDVRSLEGFEGFAKAVSQRGCKIVSNASDAAGTVSVLYASPHRLPVVLCGGSAIAPPSFNVLKSLYQSQTPTKTFRGVTVLTDAALVDGLGGVVWDGAYALVQHFEKHIPLGVSRVLELGCGTGLGALCLHKMNSAADFIVTDEFVDLAEINAERYGADRGVTVMPLKWGAPVPAAVGGIDFVVGSEITPMLQGHEALCATIKELLEGNAGCVCVLSVDCAEEDTAPFEDVGGGYARAVRELNKEECLGNAARKFLERCFAAGLSAKVAAVERVEEVLNMEDEAGCCAAIVYITKEEARIGV
jgi:serine/threonine protein kinase